MDNNNISSSVLLHEYVSNEEITRISLNNQSSTVIIDNFLTLPDSEPSDNKPKILPDSKPKILIYRAKLVNDDK